MALGPALRLFALVAVLLPGCGGDRPPAADAPPAAIPVADTGDVQPGPGDDAGAGASTAMALRDPVPLTARVEAGGRSAAYDGPGECHHTANASIYEVPATMWAARFGTDAGGFRELNLTLWEARGTSAPQIMLHLTAGGSSHEIATTQRADPKGSGTARIERKGAGGTLTVEGKDENGRALRLTVECSRFTEPVAEGG